MYDMIDLFEFVWSYYQITTIADIQTKHLGFHRTQCNISFISSGKNGHDIDSARLDGLIN